MLPVPFMLCAGLSLVMRASLLLPHVSAGAPKTQKTRGGINYQKRLAGQALQQQKDAVERLRLAVAAARDRNHRIAEFKLQETLEVAIGVQQELQAAFDKWGEKAREATKARAAAREAAAAAQEAARVAAAKEAARVALPEAGQQADVQGGGGGGALFKDPVCVCLL